MSSRSKSISHILFLFALLASLIGNAVNYTPSYAAGLVVNSLLDNTTSGDQLCTLREAIATANNGGNGDCGANSPVADTITFSVSGTITLGSILLDSTDAAGLTIDGTGQTVTISGGGLYRVFYVQSFAPLTLNNLTIANGSNIGDVGGGIVNNGSDLTITNSTISGNSTDTFAGGIYTGGGTLTITNSTISGNSVSGGGHGGGIYVGGGTVTITNSTIASNSVSSSGGGIYQSAGTVTFFNTIVANNTGGNCAGTITDGGNNLDSSNTCGFTVNAKINTNPMLGPLADNGGLTQTFALTLSSPALGAGDNTVCDDNPGPNNLDQRGVTRPQGGTCDIGAYESNAQPGPTLEVNTNEDSNDGFCDAFVTGVTDCTLREAINYANSTAGTWTLSFDAALNTTPITLGSQLPAITGTIIINGNGAANTIIQANVAANTATYRVFQVSTGNLTLDSLTVRNGRCNGSCATDNDNGGGVYNAGTLTVTNSVIANNSSANLGGGIHNSGTLTILKSTFSDNSAVLGGGGLYNASNLTLANSTFSGNSATDVGGGAGGGLYNAGNPATVKNSTFSANTASGNGSGIFNIDNLTLYNSILANSTSGVDCYTALGAVSGNNNLIETDDGGANACVTSLPINSDPNLGSLTGSPAYFPLLAGSMAINAGDDSICAAAPVSNTSQNGVTRPQGSHCDIGSFEITMFNSLGLNDGWILESSETSGTGGTMDSTATTFNLGDDFANKQYRAILHFDTSSLPDTAVITSATLRIKKYKQIGSNPFTILAGLKVDMRKPSFGTTALALTDFKSAAGKGNVATFGATALNNWYSAILNNTGNLYINRMGSTQFRIYFTTDDNNDHGNDYMRFYSGNYSNITNRPQLVIEYYVP